jgi:prepilin-type N-terminal cleavage/methylation domain-containing protein
MRLQNIKKNQKGFTIVELLIVIVVIGILAAITIVAFNGIQNRAKDTKASELANQLRGKVASWQAVKGSYPAQSDITGGLTDLTNAPEAKLDAGLLSNIYTGATAVTGAAHQTNANGPLVSYQICTGGAKIYYYQTSGTDGSYDVGSPTACA